MLSHIMENSEKINEFKEFKKFLALVLSFEVSIFLILRFFILLYK